MAIMTMSAGPSALSPAAARPYVSSPLASNSCARPAHARTSSCAPSFPVSRPLRPFPSIANVSGLPQRAGSAAGKKPVKIIEPPAGFKGAFTLNLTQAELSRQD
ncbi:hypothetical protein CERSUDRAFT_79369 [Gelatoporia subvermispora B]|uniref:Uncharacterized protein n=1 Tax=Ceriporiopsis subvermispora (strain B) TaxID=914234 RepID=M2PXU0_CERS8|nr:hypothetical protein CERSUDRAFT_79369 [Gelatoporia subvermispora B]